MRYVQWLLAALVVAGFGFALYVRLAPSDAAVWHVDPLTAEPTGKPNAWRVGPEASGAQEMDAPAPVYRTPAENLATRLDMLVRAQPRTQALATSADGLWTTYVVRSRWMGFPDYVSVQAIDLGEGRSTVAIYSRARFGTSDLGVNRARIEDWLTRLEAPRD